MSTCSSCGRRHGLMELCPVKPGLLDCLLRFIEGERDAITWLASVGLAALLFLAVLAIQVAESSAAVADAGRERTRLGAYPTATAESTLAQR